MAFVKTRKFTNWIGTAITSIILVIGSQSVNLSPAASQTPDYSAGDRSADDYSAELVYNGTFTLDPLVDPNHPTMNNPNITGWTKSGDPRDTANIRISNKTNTRGNWALSLGGLMGISYISQNIPTIPGKYYQLTYYLASGDSAPYINNEFQTFVGGKLIDDEENLTGSLYKKYQFTFQASEESTELKFGSQTRYHFLYLADISVKEVPEPSADVTVKEVSAPIQPAVLKRW